MFENFRFVRTAIQFGHFVQEIFASLLCSCIFTGILSLQFGLKKDLKVRNRWNANVSLNNSNRRSRNRSYGNHLNQHIF